MFDSGTLGLGGAEVPVPFFLIRHPQEDVLVDGGNPLAVARDARAHWGALAEHFEVHMTEGQHCEAQLRRLGLAPESVGRVVQTHLHIDHTGALGHFPSAPVLVHARELRGSPRGRGSPLASGYVREDYERPELRWQPVEEGAGPVRRRDGADCSRRRATPPGTCRCCSTSSETGPVLLTADAADNRAQWEGRAHPRALFSREDATRSRERLRELAARARRARRARA